jgi:hypothetical protein
MPLFTIQTPDGRTLDIESGTQESAVAGAQDWVSKNPAPKSGGPGFAAYVDRFGNEVTLGALDRAQAAVRSLTGGKSYSQAFKEEKASSEADAAQMGTATKIGMGIAGAVPAFMLSGPVGAAAKLGMSAARTAPVVGGALANLSRASQAAKAAMPQKLAQAASALVPAQGGIVRGAASTGAAGAALGGVEAALRGNDVTGGALTGATVGGLLGGAGTAISRAIAKPKVAPAQSADELLAAGGNLFNKARAGYTYIIPEAADKIRDRMRQSVSTFSSDPRLMPKTQEIIKNNLNARGTGMTIEQLDDLRQVLGDQSRRQKTGMYDRDSAGLTSMRASLMEEASNLTSRDITGAIAPGANRLEKLENLQEGIKTWGRGRKAKTISDLINDSGITAGKYTQSGAENAIRTKFRQLAEDKREMNFYTKKEQEMIRKIAEGTISRNILRRLGKFAPDNLVKGIPYMFAGTTGIPFAAAAWAARGAANRQAGREAQDVLDFVSRGGPGQQLPISDLRKRLAQYTTAAGKLGTIAGAGQ